MTARPLVATAFLFQRHSPSFSRLFVVSPVFLAPLPCFLVSLSPRLHSTLHLALSAFPRNRDGRAERKTAPGYTWTRRTSLRLSSRWIRSVTNVTNLVEFRIAARYSPHSLTKVEYVASSCETIRILNRFRADLQTGAAFSIFQPQLVSLACKRINPLSYNLQKMLLHRVR